MSLNQSIVGEAALMWVGELGDAMMSISLGVGPIRLSPRWKTKTAAPSSYHREWISRRLLVLWKVTLNAWVENPKGIAIIQPSVARNELR